MASAGRAALGTALGPLGSLRESSLSLMGAGGVSIASRRLEGAEIGRETQVL